MVVRLLGMAFTLFGLFASHLAIFYVGRLEGLQNAKRQPGVMANGLYESMLTPEINENWSDGSKAMATMIRRMLIDEINCTNANGTPASKARPPRATPIPWVNGR
jgi:hypothetical protein